MSQDTIQPLLALLEQLLGPQGCPWDRAQTPESMRRHLLEETYEVLDEISVKPAKPQDLCEELGDLLYTVLLTATIAGKAHGFSLDQVVKGVCSKLIDRHPHVFSDSTKPVTAAEGLSVWEAQKAKKNPNRSRLAGVPSSLPALLTAHRQGEKAAAVGFDWPSHHGVLDKVEEELGELKEAILDQQPADISHEIGDLLMATASLGRHLQLSAEDSLRSANARFRSRFEHMEQLAKDQDIALQHQSPEQLERLWELAKEQENA